MEMLWKSMDRGVLPILKTEVLEVALEEAVEVEEDVQGGSCRRFSGSLAGKAHWLVVLCSQALSFLPLSRSNNLSLEVEEALS